MLTNTGKSIYEGCDRQLGKGFKTEHAAYPATFMQPPDSPVRLHSRPHLKIAVSVITLDHVCDMLAALHPRLNQLGKHLEDLLTGACALLPENWWCDSTELEPEVVLPMLKIRSSFPEQVARLDGRKVRIV